MLKSSETSCTHVTKEFLKELNKPKINKIKFTCYAILKTRTKFECTQQNIAESANLKSFISRMGNKCFKNKVYTSAYIHISNKFLRNQYQFLRKCSIVFNLLFMNISKQ